MLAQLEGLEEKFKAILRPGKEVCNGSSKVV